MCKNGNFMKMHEIKEKSVCIGILMGIPGSGKSYFCRFLQDHFAKCHDSVLKNVHVICVCYDEFVKHESLYSSAERWKDHRKKVFANVENLVCALKGFGTFDECPLIKNIDQENMMKSECVLLLIDDNMYYRSMRYQYYQLARRFSVSFCQFYLKADLRNAMKFNKTRDLQYVVPEEIILNMWEKFEPPDVKNSWERLSLTIDSHEDFANSPVIMSIHNIIVESLNNPVDSSMENDSEKMKARECTNSSVIHQLDIAMRHWIERQMKQTVAQGAKSDLRLLGKSYSNRKKQILNALKTGTLTLPSDVNSFLENRTTKNYEELYKFIERIF